MMKIDKKYLNVPLYIWISFLLSIPFFTFFSQIDLFISHLFYRDNIFFLNDTLAEKFFHISIRPIIIIAILTPLAVFTYNHYYKKNIWDMTKRKLLYIFLVLALAPGLIVNIFLKEGFERPRPKQIIEFGSKKEFYPAYTFTNQGKDSFSSGHVAAAFSLMGLAMLAKRRRDFWINLTLIYGTGMMVARVAAGGHFFSDVVTSFFIVYISTHILYKYLIEDKEDNVT